MKTWAKIALGVIGATVCGGGGYMLFRYLKRRRQEEANNKAIEVVAYIPWSQDDFNKEVDAAIAADPRSVVVRDDDDKNHSEVDISKERLANRIKDYTGDENFESYLASMESPEDDDSDEDDDDDQDDIPHRGADAPYPITAGEFCNTRTYYDKVSLNYFKKDDVVADDRDAIMENANYILGDLNSYEDEDHCGVVFVRNEALEVDYEITLVNGSYRKEVLKLDEEV